MRDKNKSGTPKNSSPYKNHYKDISQHEVTKDKLFCNENESNNYEFSDFVRRSEDGDNKNRNEWDAKNAKPGVDVSQFYNPSNADHDNSHSQSRIHFDEQVNIQNSKIKKPNSKQSGNNRIDEDGKHTSLHHSVELNRTLPKESSKTIKTKLSQEKLPKIEPQPAVRTSKLSRKQEIENYKEDRKIDYKTATYDKDEQEMQSYEKHPTFSGKDEHSNECIEDDKVYILKNNTVQHDTIQRPNTRDSPSFEEVEKLKNDRRSDHNNLEYALKRNHSKDSE